MLEDISTIVLGDSLEDYLRGHQHPNVKRDARGLC